MKTVKNILLIAVLASISLFAVKDAIGKTHTSFSVSFGSHQPVSRSMHQPAYSGRFSGDRHFQHVRHHNYRVNGFYSGLIIQRPYVIQRPYIVERPYIIERPVVVERQTVIVETPVAVEDYTSTAGTDEETQKLFAYVREKKEDLLDRLETGGKAERINAIRELAGLSYDGKVIESLKDILLNDPDPDLRKEAAGAFGKGGNEKVIPILEEVRVEDSDRGVRQEAAKAIKAIEKN